MILNKKKNFSYCIKFTVTDFKNDNTIFGYLNFSLNCALKDCTLYRTTVLKKSLLYIS